MLDHPINIAFLKRATDNHPHIFDDIVTAIQALLQRAGINVVVNYNTIVPDTLNIVVGAGMPGAPSIAELRHFARPDNTIIFNSEQLGSDSVLITDEYLQLLSEYVVWDYCQYNIDILRHRKPAAHHCHEFPLVPAQSFSILPQDLPTNRNFDYDFAFYGAVNIPRRINTLQNLQQHGLRIKLITGAFGSNLALQLLNCKAVLNLHAYETGLFEIGRCLRPMALGIPILSEISLFPSCVNWHNSGIVFCNKEELAIKARALVDHIPAQQSALRRMQHFMADHRLPNLAREILQATLQQLKSH